MVVIEPKTVEMAESPKKGLQSSHHNFNKSKDNEGLISISLIRGLQSINRKCCTEKCIRTVWLRMCLVGKGENDEEGMRSLPIALCCCRFLG